MKVIGRDNNKNKVMLEDRTVVLMTDDELEAAMNPQEKSQKSPTERKDIQMPDDSKGSNGDKEPDFGALKARAKELGVNLVGTKKIDWPKLVADAEAALQN